MKQYPLLLCLILFLVQCRSAQKEYEKGRYNNAIEKSLKKLDKNKDVRKHKSILNRSIVALYKELEQNTQKGTSIEEKEAVYRSLIQLATYISESGSYLTSHSQEALSGSVELTNDVKEKIIDILYNRGQSYLTQANAEDSKVLARRAHQDLYNLWRNYNPPIDNLKRMVDEAFQKAITNLLFESDVNFNFSERNEVDRVFRDIEGQRGYYNISYDRYIDNIDCRIELDFGRINEQNSSQTERRTFRKEIQDGYTTKVDTSGNTTKTPKYVTITGYVDVIKTTYSLEWEMQADVRQESKHCQFRDQRFRRSENQVVEQYRLSGDVRAIPSEYARNNNARYDKQQLMRRVLEQLYDDVNNYYIN